MFISGNRGGWLSIFRDLVKLFMSDSELSSFFSY